MIDFRAPLYADDFDKFDYLIARAVMLAVGGSYVNLPTCPVVEGHHYCIQFCLEKYGKRLCLDRKCPHSLNLMKLVDLCDPISSLS